MLNVKFGEQHYTFDLQEQLTTLTGAESMMVEDFLGGWARFRDPANLSRSMIVMVWLAQRSGGTPDSLEKIAATPGLVFGEVIEVDGDTDDPADPAVEPDRPLADQNGSNGSNGGDDDAVTTLETSDSSGLHHSVVSTG